MLCCSGRYELAPSAENLQAAASALLGQPLAELLRCRVEPAELTRGPGAGHVFGSMLTVGGGGGQPAPLTVVLQPTQVIPKQESSALHLAQEA